MGRVYVLQRQQSQLLFKKKCYSVSSENKDDSWLTRKSVVDSIQVRLELKVRLKLYSQCFFM